MPANKERPQGDPAAEQWLGLGARARVAARTMFDANPNLAVSRTGRYAVASATSEPQQVVFSHNTTGDQDTLVQLTKATGNPNTNPPKLRYYIGPEGKIKVDRRELHKQERTEAMLQDLDYPEPHSWDRGLADMTLPDRVRERINADKETGRDTLSAQEAYELLTGLQRDLGDTWQTTVQIPDPADTDGSSEAFVPAFVQIIKDQATGEIKTETKWQRGHMVSLLTQYEGPDVDTQISLLQQSTADQRAGWESWTFYPDGRCQWMQNIPTPHDPVAEFGKEEEGIGKLELAAKQETLLKPNPEAFAQAAAHALEIHSRTSLTTRYKSEPQAVYLGSSESPFFVTFERSVEPENDELQAVASIIVRKRRDSERELLELNAESDGTFTCDFNSFEQLVELGIYQETDQHEYRHDISPTRAMRFLRSVQQQLGDAGRNDVTVPEDESVDEQGIVRALRESVAEKTLPHPAQTIQRSQWEEDGAMHTLETTSDRQGNPQSLYLEIVTYEEHGQGVVVESMRVWEFTPDEPIQYVPSATAVGRVPPEHPQKELIEQALERANEELQSRAVGNIFPADPTDIQAGIDSLEESARTFRERDEVTILGQTEPGVVEEAFFGETRSDTDPQSEVQEEEDQEGGAWTAGSHRSGKPGKRKPHVELRGTDGETREVNLDEGDEPEKGNSNGRE